MRQGIFNHKQADKNTTKEHRKSLVVWQLLALMKFVSVWVYGRMSVEHMSTNRRSWLIGQKGWPKSPHIFIYLYIYIYIYILLYCWGKFARLNTTQAKSGEILAKFLGVAGANSAGEKWKLAGANWQKKEKGHKAPHPSTWSITHPARLALRCRPLSVVAVARTTSPPKLQEISIHMPPWHSAQFPSFPMVTPPQVQPAYRTMPPC